MNGRNKAVRLALILIILGILFCVVALTTVGFDIRRFNTGNYVTNVYEVEGEIRSITVNGDTEKILFLPTDDGGCRVVCREEEKKPHTVRVDGENLTVEKPDRKNIHFFDFSFLTEEPSVTVFLPETAYETLTVDTNTGNVGIPADFSFDRINMTLSTGDVNCQASVADIMSIQTSTGQIHLTDLNAGRIQARTSTGGIRVANVTCEKDLEVHVSTGGTTLENVACESFTSTGSTGSLTMKNVIASGTFLLERSTGSILFDSCDAGSIIARTSTGSVTGTLQTDKVFNARSSTGSVDVPGTAAGGRCEISTQTGRIRISIGNK